MDVALAIEGIYPAAKYFGSTVDNTKECFDKLNWRDERPKPTWEDLQTVWPEVQAKYALKESNEKLISDKIAAMAIDALKAEGKLPPEYVETKDAK